MQFKVGDRVKLKSGSTFPNGEYTWEIREIRSVVVYFEGGTSCHINQLELVYPNPPHKHRDLIIEWANGADIQIWSAVESKWLDNQPPHWYEVRRYRVKPKKSERDIERGMIMEFNQNWKNIRLTSYLFLLILYLSLIPALITNYGIENNAWGFRSEIPFHEAYSVFVLAWLGSHIFIFMVIICCYQIIKFCFFISTDYDTLYTARKALMNSEHFDYNTFLVNNISIDEVSNYMYVNKVTPKNAVKHFIN